MIGVLGVCIGVLNVCKGTLGVGTHASVLSTRGIGRVLVDEPLFSGSCQGSRWERAGLAFHFPPFSLLKSISRDRDRVTVHWTCRPWHDEQQSAHTVAGE